MAGHWCWTGRSWFGQRGGEAKDVEEVKEVEEKEDPLCNLLSIRNGFFVGGIGVRCDF
jgi:hypothetical protein